MVLAPVHSSVRAAEFLASSESEGYELVHGEMEALAVGGESSWIGGEVFGLFRDHLKLDPQGVVFPQDTAIAVWQDDPDHVRKPDVFFIARGRLPQGRLPQGYVTVVPDLIVEIVSPNDDAGKLEAKLQDYRRVAVPLVWVIYPETRNAYVYRRGSPIEVVEGGGNLDGGDVLPGFLLSLASLFAAADAVV